MNKQASLLRDDKLADLANAQESHDAALKIYERKKADAKDAKDDADACQGQVNSIVKDLRDIERGEYQPDLPFGTDNPAPHDTRFQTVILTTATTRKTPRITKE